ncbi:TetR/AcrR family transcriptional regulator [Parasphingorhabdus pacifica]
MVASTVALMQERGVEATSLADVLAHSGTPRGSIYHHFPGGKSQLVQEATRSASTDITTFLTRLLDAGDTVTALRGLVDWWRRGLAEHDHAFGCPIVAAALGTDEEARELASRAFADWAELITESLAADGMPPERARSVSTLFLSALEGALVIAQAKHDAAPLDDVIAELEALVHADHVRKP